MKVETSARGYQHLVLVAAILEHQHLTLRAIKHLPDKPPVLKTIMEGYEQGLGEIFERWKEGKDDQKRNRPAIP